MSVRFLPAADRDAVAAVAAELLELAGLADAGSDALRAEAELQAERVIFARRLERRRCEEAERSLRVVHTTSAADITHATLQRACAALLEVPAAASDAADGRVEGAPEMRAA